MIAISTCLLGVDCRYDGGDNEVLELINAFKAYGILPVCPEQFGGLTTPRMPSEIVSIAPYRIETKDGIDVTEAFLKGAEESLKLAKLLECKYAVLKAKSPSCGSKYVYDGSFSGVLREGQGATAALFEKHGIEVFNEKNFHVLLEKLGVANG